MRTFVVRIWHPAEGEAGIEPIGLRGTVESADRTSPPVPFPDEAGLIGALYAALTPGEAAVEAGLRPRQLSP